MRELRLQYEQMAARLMSARVDLDAARAAFKYRYKVIWPPEIPTEQVRMGMRVEGLWKPREEREGSLTDIRYFRPTGEPDVTIERFIDKL